MLLALVIPMNFPNHYLDYLSNAAYLLAHILLIVSVLWFILAGKRKFGALLLHTFLAAIASYLLCLCVAIPAQHYYLKRQMESTALGTPEHNEAKEKYCADGGRLMYFMIGLFEWPYKSVLCHLVIGVPYLLIMLLITRKKESPASTTD